MSTRAAMMPLPLSHLRLAYVTLAGASIAIDGGPIWRMYSSASLQYHQLAALLVKERPQNTISDRLLLMIS